MSLVFVGESPTVRGEDFPLERLSTIPDLRRSTSLPERRRDR